VHPVSILPKFLEKLEQNTPVNGYNERKQVKHLKIVANTSGADFFPTGTASQEGLDS
jgi:hypothetical protein